MDKQFIAKSNHIHYIDVWPINAFNPKNEDPFDVVSQFMMQLACIINMLPVWKKLHLRVFLCETNESHISSTFSVNSAGSHTSNEKSADVKLREMLKSLRIEASIHQV